MKIDQSRLEINKNYRFAEGIKSDITHDLSFLKDDFMGRL